MPTLQTPPALKSNSVGWNQWTWQKHLRALHSLFQTTVIMLTFKEVTSVIVLYGVCVSRIRYEWTDAHRHPHINPFMRTDSGEIQIAVQNEFPQQWGRHNSLTDFIMLWPLTLATGFAVKHYSLAWLTPLWPVTKEPMVEMVRHISSIFFLSSSSSSIFLCMCIYFFSSALPFKLL